MGIPTLILQLPGKTSKTSTSGTFHLDFMQLFQVVKTCLPLSPRMWWEGNTQQTSPPCSLRHPWKDKGCSPSCGWATQVPVSPAENGKPWTGCCLWLATINLPDWPWTLLYGGTGCKRLRKCMCWVTGLFFHPMATWWRKTSYLSNHYWKPWIHIRESQFSEQAERCGCTNLHWCCFICSSLLYSLSMCHGLVFTIWIPKSLISCHRNFRVNSCCPVILASR